MASGDRGWLSLRLSGRCHREPHDGGHPTGRDGCARGLEGSPGATEFPELISVLGSAVPPWEDRTFRTPDEVEAVVPVPLRVHWEVDHSVVK
jgi:hypothetical protein